MRFINTNQQVNSIRVQAITGAGFEVLRNCLSTSLRLERICVWLSQATSLPGTAAVRAFDFLADIQPGHKPMSTATSDKNPDGTRMASYRLSDMFTRGSNVAIPRIGLS